MERGKGSSTRGKPKNQHFPSDLFVLGSKSAGSDAAKRPIPSGSGERKREQPSMPIVGGKKAKLLPTPTPLGRPTSSSSPTILPSSFELWETQAIDVEPSELVDAVLESCQANQHEKATNLVLGGLKILKNTKWKPDSILTVGLLYLAKIRSSLFCSELATQALSVLLRRDPQHNFKIKGNPTVQVLAANLLARGHHDSKHWPNSFIKLYIEDAMGDRIWVDQVECKGFVNNILTGFGTKLPPPNLNFLIPEMGPMGLSRSDSPLTIATEEDEDNGAFDIPVMPRFTKSQDSIEQIILDMQNNRRQTPESVTRNYLKLLASTAGMIEVRVFVMARLEMWLQNPKLMKPAQELLLSVCVNCSSNTPKDTQVIASVVKMRVKTKSGTNFYLASIRELINAHPENLYSVLKHTVYNELSSSRNPNNLPMIGVIFQTQPEESASLFADIILELLYSRDDFLRSIRLFLREIVRTLRHDINFLALCRGLMADKRETPAFRDFEFKERMFNAIVDLLAHACCLGVSPVVKESLNLVARGDKREVQTLINFHTMVATIQQEALIWLKDLAWKIYRPSPIDFVHALHKIVFMEQPEAYYKIDMWPPESERTLILRLAAESPLYETTLFTILIIGLSKDHSISGPDALELADQLVKRTAGISADFLPMLTVTRQDLFDVVLKVTAYHHPDNISLPAGYTPPKLAISNCYWKAWVMLLIICAHNPGSLGALAWEKYPTLRMLMEMCITNHFTYPPPTMQQTDNTEDSKGVEARISPLEREQILEFETHLAAASTKATITEATSLLLPQLTTMDPFLPARKPPPAILEQLASLNRTHRLGHLLCRSRQPDFLLDLIQRQGASQSMPWLADLVENSESSLSHLPLQCLCEFLLTSGPPEKQSKGQQLVDHLQNVLKSEEQDANAASEIIEYLLRRLSVQHMSSRVQAIKGLKLVLSDGEENLDLPAYLQDCSWLLHHLPTLPHFKYMRPHVVAALRQACLVENEPGCIASYIQFLSIHTDEDELMAMTLLVHDMADFVVERSTIMHAVMPNGGLQDPLRTNTHHSLMLIFYSYLEKVRQPRGKAFEFGESPDPPVLVQWPSGEEAYFQLVVVHAMVILLCVGEGNDPELYDLMLNVWFPEGPAPKAFIGENEAVLIPDWLKLRMVRSGVPRLVEAALQDLPPSQLVLFIQSFGIPIRTMTTLLETLDRLCPLEFLGEAAPYITQLVTVQDRRGASGGQVFIATHGTPQENYPPAFKKTVPKSKHQNVSQISMSNSTKYRFNPKKLTAHLYNAFLAISKKEAFDELQRMLLIGAKTDEIKLNCMKIIAHEMMSIVEKPSSFSEFTSAFKQRPFNSCIVTRLIWSQMSILPENLKNQLISSLKRIVTAVNSTNPLLLSLQQMIVDKNEEQRPSVKPTIGTLLGTPRANIGHIIDFFVDAEPELMSSATENEMRMVLFGRPIKSETAAGVMEECRPYLLTLLSHKASWGRLQTIVDQLLAKFENFYSPSAVLDFLVAMTHNPRLWQGREKDTPKHQISESVLNLSKNQVLNLVEYIIEEAVSKDGGNDVNERPAFLDLLETRLPLLLESLDEEFLEPVVRHLTRDTDDPLSIRANACKNLLILLYFQVPRLIQILVGAAQESLLKGAVISGWSSSTLDKISHTLLTGLTSSFTDAKDGPKKSNELELAARKMAVVHPALVLRQLPMLAASMLGRVHFDYHILKTRNHLVIFHQVLGIIDLLRPRIFDKIYRHSLHILLDSYLTLCKLHGTQKTVVHMLAKLIQFLQNYVVLEPAAATKYFQNNSQTLIAIQKRNPNMSSLRALLSGVLTLREDTEETEGGQPVAIVSAPSDLVVTAPPYILNALARGQYEDNLTALQDLDHISSRSPAILESVTEQITELLTSPYTNVRSLAHSLLVRLFKHNPQIHALTGYLRCLESGQGDVISSALEKLPEMVICSQEHAVLLLEKAFQLSVHSNIGTSSITKAIAALNQQTGC